MIMPFARHYIRAGYCVAISMRGEKILKEPASTIMTTRIVTATEEQDSADLMRMMTEGKFRHIPIIRQGRLVGVVSIG